jgi:glutathione S-transferase
MSTCSQKVRLALAETGVGWTGHHLDLRAGDQHRPEYLALNPGGVVPTLVHDARPIIESTVINEYIADGFDGARLRPADAAAKAGMRLWTKQLDEGVHAMTGVLSTCIAFRFQHFAVKTRDEVVAGIEAIPDAAKRERQRENILKGLESRFFAGAVARFDRLLGDIEAALMDSRWLAGDAYSLADIAYTPYMVRLEHLQLAWMWDHRPHIPEWFERLRARPSFETAVTAWFNDKYLPLMAEKGAEAVPRVKSILAG